MRAETIVSLLLVRPQRPAGHGRSAQVAQVGRVKDVVRLVVQGVSECIGRGLVYLVGVVTRLDAMNR